MVLNKHILSALGLAAMLVGSAVHASSAQIQVNFTNNAPTGGTLQTTVWVGFHDG